ncbi:MAG: GntR family transcriptional regulator [Kiritimatiellae bacterium]|nr:GntR family transcriptional regulator [Kiritimatiellia bacterium]
MSMNRPSAYAKIADKLRHDILAGRLKPGAKLPTERELSARLAVTRMTVRRALRVLEDERLVRRRQGSGTYVGPNPSRRIPLMIDYTGSIREHAPKLNRTVKLCKWQPADATAADLLQVDASRDFVLYAERVDDLEGAPVAWDQAYIAAAFGRQLTERHLARVDFVEMWCRAGAFEVTFCDQTVEAVPAAGPTLRYLRVARGKPLLRSTEVYYTRGDRPAGLFLSYYDPDHISIKSRFSWNPGAPGSGKQGRRRPSQR